MPQESSEPIDDGGAGDSVGQEFVEREQNQLREFIKGLSGDDLRSGDWFTKLCSHALSTYTEKATWEYFQEKYEGLPADAIVDQRITMAARYAALEGGLSAGAYTAAIAATIGSIGGASPITVPAAVATLLVDVAFITQLQLRLAYDVSVLYRVPLDVSDPEDLWKLIRVSFTIKSGEAVREGVTKIAPALVRPIVKKFFGGPVLVAAKSLPVVGKFLLQRNLIKVGIPLIGVPLAVVLNRYSTLVAGRHARAVFRNEARIIELADRLSARSKHPQLMLWVAWLVVMADGKIVDDETQLVRHLTRLVRDRHQVVDDELARIVDLDSDEVWRRFDSEEGDVTCVIEAAHLVAAVDGPANSSEAATLARLALRGSGG